MAILIVGAGIGGLAAAVALKRAGRDIVVLERAGELREVGAALALGVNAMVALRHLGLADAILRSATRVVRVEIRSQSGKLLCGIDGGDLARRRGVPSVCIDRADLQSILAEAVGADGVRFGARCVDVDADAQRATVRLESGGEVHGEAIVGADGINSAVRRALGDGGKPRYAGYVAWRGIARCDVPAGTGVELWGRARRFGYAPLVGGRTYWYATRNAPQGATTSRGNREDVLAEFGTWRAPVPELIAATDAAAVLRHDMLDRPPTRRWGRGRITLLGDAAHAMTPNLGQGACQAIEDAVTLALCLDRTPDVADALRAYESARIPRTSAMTRQSWRVGRVGQLENRVACALRDWAMRLTPESVNRRRLEWTQGWEPP